MKKNLTFLIILSSFFFFFFTFTSCTKSEKPLLFDFLTKDGTVFATSTVTITFEISDDALHVFEYLLDDTATGTTTVPTITFEELSVGEHHLSLYPLETPTASKTLFFSVNLDGPTVQVKTADREYAIDGSAAPMGRNALVYWSYDTFDLSTQRMAILEYDNNWGKLLVLDGEGGFTKVSPYLDPDAFDKAWITLPDTKRSFYVSDRRVVINDIFYDLFEIGKAYNIYVQGQSDLGTWGNVGNINFRLDERYNSDESPVIEMNAIDLILPTADASGSITINFTGNNLKQYCSQPIHDYFQNDTSRNSELMYLQFGVDLLFYGASITSVQFPHFKQGYDDLSFYKETYWGFTFSRAFVENEQNTTEGTDILVTLELALDTSVLEDGLYFVIPYSDLYLRDQDNRTIDGVQVDHSILQITTN